MVDYNFNVLKDLAYYAGSVLIYVIGLQSSTVVIVPPPSLCKQKFCWNEENNNLLSSPVKEWKDVFVLGSSKGRGVRESFV